MKLYVFLLTWLMVFARIDGLQPHVPRFKRATGALHIVTNHAQPIHADVKSENADGTINTEKVTAPVDSYYLTKSLRKSLSESPSKIDLARNVGRVITMTVLLISAALEFFPLLKSVYNSVYSFLYL